MDNTPMKAGRQTLLAKLAPLFGPRTENLAVEALGHILSASEPARRAVSDVLRAGGADIGEVVQVRTQTTGEDGERPDLVGFDECRAERLLIEAKFWAGLTDNQPVVYLKGLAKTANFDPKGPLRPCALLFVAPAARLEPLWNELRRLVEDSGLLFEPAKDAAELRSANVGGDRTFLMLTSWRNLLSQMAAQVGAAGESHTEADIRQLQGLAEQQDDAAFLPLRQEELGPEFPRRLRNLRRLVDDATDRAQQQEFLDTKGLKVTPQAWGYGRYVRLRGQTPWFGIHADPWAQTGWTPLWLSFWDPDPAVLAVLDSLRGAVPPAHGSQDRFVPIYLPVGKEYEAVLDAVVCRLGEIRDWLQG